MTRLYPINISSVRKSLQENMRGKEKALWTDHKPQSLIPHTTQAEGWMGWGSWL